MNVGSAAAAVSIQHEKGMAGEDRTRWKDVFVMVIGGIGQPHSGQVGGSGGAVVKLEQVRSGQTVGKRGAVFSKDLIDNQSPGSGSGVHCPRARSGDMRGDARCRRIDKWVVLIIAGVVPARDINGMRTVAQTGERDRSRVGEWGVVYHRDGRAPGPIVEFPLESGIAPRLRGGRPPIDRAAWANHEGGGARSGDPKRHPGKSNSKGVVAAEVAFAEPGPGCGRA